MQVTDKAVEAALEVLLWKATSGNRTTVRRAIEAALSALGKEGWRTMDSAPKDGTPFLAFRRLLNGGSLQCVVSWREGRRGDTCWETAAITWRSDSGHHMQPTHWRPLPADPEADL